MAGYKYSQIKMRRDGRSEAAVGLPEESPPPLANIDIYSSISMKISSPGRATTLDGNGSAHMLHLMKALQLKNVSATRSTLLSLRKATLAAFQLRREQARKSRCALGLRFSACLSTTVAPHQMSLGQHST